MKRVMIISATVLLTMSLAGCGLQEKVQQSTNELSNLSFSAYDDAQVSGSTVLQAVTLYGNQAGIQVFTGMTADEGYYAKTDLTFINSDGEALESEISDTVPLEEMKNNSSLYYVNPTGIFDSKVYKDKDGTVRLIEMRQRVNLN